jgi:hypothetical protein
MRISSVYQNNFHAIYSTSAAHFPRDSLLPLAYGQGCHKPKILHAHHRAYLSVSISSWTAACKLISRSTRPRASRRNTHMHREDERDLKWASNYIAAAVANFISNERAALCCSPELIERQKRSQRRLNEKRDYKVAAAQNSHSPPQIERLDKLNYLFGIYALHAASKQGKRPALILISF